MTRATDKLSLIAKKQRRRVIGVLSGTSMDGLDIGCWCFDGVDRKTEFTLEQFATVPFPAALQHALRNVAYKGNISLPTLCSLNNWLGQWIADTILDCLRHWQLTPAAIDLIASHGQTIYHTPRSLSDGLQIEQSETQACEHSTLQIGDGDQVAQLTGIITLSDFRQKHVAGGGEGAPLAIYLDYLLHQHSPHDRAVYLNLGGIANLSFFPSKSEFTQAISTDIGPANTLMDEYCRRYLSINYDQGGQLAAQGTPDYAIVDSIMEHTFFATPFPKSTGQETFSLTRLLSPNRLNRLLTLTPSDALASLNLVSVLTISNAVKSITEYGQIELSGGGAFNHTLVSGLKRELDRFTVEISSDPQWTDGKETLLFALLANQTIAGTDNQLFSGNSAHPNVRFGKISLPD